MALALSGCIEHVAVTQDGCESDPLGCSQLIQDSHTQMQQVLDSGVVDHMQPNENLDMGDDQSSMFDETVLADISISDAEIVSDIDNDGILDNFDNCISIANPDQIDANNNGVGDACESSLDSLDNECEWTGGVCLASCNNSNFNHLRSFSYIYSLANSEYLQGRPMHIGCFDVCTDQEEIFERQAMFLTRYELINQNKPNVRWFRNNQEFFPLQNGNSEMISHGPNECIRYSAVAQESNQAYAQLREDEVIRGSESFSVSVYYLDRRVAGMSVVTLSPNTNNIYYKTSINNSARELAEQTAFASINLTTSFNSESNGALLFRGSCEFDTRIQKYPVLDDGLSTVFIAANTDFALRFPSLGLSEGTSLHFAIAGDNPRLSYGPSICNLKVNILAENIELPSGELLDMAQTDLMQMIVPGSFLYDDREQATQELNIVVGE